MGNEGRDGEWGSGGVVGSGGEGGTEVTMWRGCFAVGNGVAGIKSFFLFFFKDYPSILVSDFSNVASRSTPVSPVDKHQHFSLDSIRLRLEWNRKQLDIPMKGVALISHGPLWYPLWSNSSSRSAPSYL